MSDQSPVGVHPITDTTEAIEKARDAWMALVRLLWQKIVRLDDQDGAGDDSVGQYVEDLNDRTCDECGCIDLCDPRCSQVDPDPSVPVQQDEPGDVEARDELRLWPVRLDASTALLRRAEAERDEVTGLLRAVVSEIDPMELTEMYAYLEADAYLATLDVLAGSESNAAGGSEAERGEGVSPSASPDYATTPAVPSVGLRDRVACELANLEYERSGRLCETEDFYADADRVLSVHEAGTQGDCEHCATRRKDDESLRRRVRERLARIDQDDIEGGYSVVEMATDLERLARVQLSGLCVRDGCRAGDLPAEAGTQEDEV
jgi:ferredoxin